MSADRLAGDDARRALKAASLALMTGSTSAMSTFERRLAAECLARLADGDDPRALWDNRATADVERQAVRAVMHHAPTCETWDAAYDLAADDLQRDREQVKRDWLAWRKDAWPVANALPILKVKAGNSSG